MSLPNIKAIYFDLDDTLCGYWDASTKALRESFETHRPDSHSADSLLDHWSAAFREFIPEIKTDKWYAQYLASGEVTRTEQMRRTLNLAGIHTEGLASQISETYSMLRLAHLELFPDAVHVLDLLEAQYPLGLITNGPADVQRSEIEVLKIGHYFKNFFIEGEVGFGKPEAEVFKRAARAVGYQPEELMFVGNSFDHDIRPALDAGWTAVWIRRPSDIPPSTRSVRAKPEDLPEEGPQPHFQIRELSELLPILGISAPL